MLFLSWASLFMVFMHTCGLRHLTRDLEYTTLQIFRRFCFSPLLPKSSLPVRTRYPSPSFLFRPPRPSLATAYRFPAERQESFFVPFSLVSSHRLRPTALFTLSRLFLLLPQGRWIDGNEVINCSMTDSPFSFFPRSVFGRETSCMRLSLSPPPLHHLEGWAGIPFR